MLVTRPRPDAEQFAQALAGLGHEVEIEPLFEVVERPETAIDLEGIQAVLFTSANGVRAFCSALRGEPRRILNFRSLRSGMPRRGRRRTVASRGSRVPVAT